MTAGISALRGSTTPSVASVSPRQIPAHLRVRGSCSTSTPAAASNSTSTRQLSAYTHPRRVVVACRASVTPGSGTSSQLAQPAGATQAHRGSFHHGITYVSYEGNSFQVKFNTSGVRVLVDPWLVGDLTFFEQPWLYTGSKRTLGASGAVDVDEVAADTDVVLISQWVDDHTHIPTLQRLPKDLPIIAQPEAAARIAPLGFTALTTLRPGESVVAAGGRLRVTATPGALVGPPWSARQNGYVLREQSPPADPGGAPDDHAAVASLYYEPHCDFDAAGLAGVGPVDVVVSPVQSVLLGGYPLLKGSTDLQQLLRLLQPTVLVPLLNADLEQSGGLVPLMSVQGQAAGRPLADALAAAGLGVKLEVPAPPGESLAIAL